MPGKKSPGILKCQKWGGGWEKAPKKAFLVLQNKTAQTTDVLAIILETESIQYFIAFPLETESIEYFIAFPFLTVKLNPSFLNSQ